MADLLTLAEYKALVGINVTDNRKDPQITALLPAASRAVRTYASRKFELATGTPTTRTFLYDGSGILDIDDCVEITQVETDAGIVGGSLFTFTTDQWIAMPDDEDSDVFYYVLMLGGPFGGSTEMGFERNLDQYEFQPRPATISVTADWGWPAIPADVKLAAAWTVNDIVSTPAGENLSSEAIEGYARSWGSRNAGTTMLAIPNRARDLLVNYQRTFA